MVIYKQFFFTFLVLCFFSSLSFGMALMQVGPCEKVFSNLENCTAASCSYKHPMTGSLVKSEIHGIKNGKCHITEEIPVGGKRECFYSESMRKAIIQYIKDEKEGWENPGGDSVPVRLNVSGKDKKIKKYQIDGKEITNPLDAAMSQCELKIEGVNCFKDSEQYAASLETCSSFSCKFLHPFMGIIVEEKINGLKDGKCHTMQELPGVKKLFECFYPEEVRKKLAKFMKNHPLKESGTTYSMNIGNKTSYKIDGKEVENPLVEAVDKGYCKTPES